MKAIPFKEADILLPKDNFEKWAVIACDQFTSNHKYWNETRENVGNAVSSYNIILPEIYLEEGDTKKRIDDINGTMYDYLSSKVFNLYENALIYIERIQADGRVRPGIIGAVDLEAYDFSRDAKTMIRATEGTVLERIPPRVEIRKDAQLEAPHIMLLIDDINKTVIEPLAAKKGSFTRLYDFDLMMGGGHISGYLIDEKSKTDIFNSLSSLCEGKDYPLLFAVGDGNHSLATAKVCYENLKNELGDAALGNPARFALAEVGNIHSDALDFEPIYRVMFNVDVDDVLANINKYFATESPNSKIKYVYGNKEGSIDINIPSDKVSTGVIQDFIDDYLSKNKNAKVDYIHGVEDVVTLARKNNSIGFLYEGISKDTLFESVSNTGALPRKTFSMGEARDKRYYLECRKIK